MAVTPPVPPGAPGAPVGPGAAAPIVCPPRVVYRDFVIPQPVKIVHPVEIVNRYRVVPVPYHTTVVTCRDELAAVCSKKVKKRRK